MNEMSPIDSNQIVIAIVVTRNRKKLLNECLLALIAQERPVDAIIVVDNNSTDGTQEFLKKLRCIDILHENTSCSLFYVELRKKLVVKNDGRNSPPILYIRLEENTGGAGGYHEGMRIAYRLGYDWIWLMDDDAVPSASALKMLLDAWRGLNKHESESIAVLQCSVRNYQEGKLWGLFNLRNNPLKVLFRGIYKSIEPQGKLVSVDIVPYIGLLIRRDVIPIVGLPDKDLFLMVDDIDHCLRIKKHGYKIIFVEDSIMRHKIHASEPNNRKIPGRNRMYYYYTYRNNILVNWRHRDYLGISVALSSICRQVIKGMGRALQLFVKRVDKKVSKAIVLGIWHGLTGQSGPKHNRLF